jgi:hypothetical protein
MHGRRVATIADLELAGDYCGPITGFTGPDLPAVFFILPNGRDPDAPAGARSVHHVVSPPHTFRECSDGSVEIRASIGAMPFWHGYLDDGHVWREC